MQELNIPCFMFFVLGVDFSPGLLQDVGLHISKAGTVGMDWEGKNIDILPLKR